MVTIYADVPVTIHYDDAIICNAIARYNVQTRRFHVAVVNESKKDIDGRMLELISIHDNDMLIPVWEERDWKGNVLNTYKHREIYHVTLSVDDVMKCTKLQYN